MIKSELFSEALKNEFRNAKNHFIRKRKQQFPRSRTNPFVWYLKLN